MPSSRRSTEKAPQWELCGRPRLAMALLMLTQQPAEARYRGLNASETQQMPAHRLSRSDDRLAGSRLHCLDNRMRAEIETRGDQPVGLRVPGAERQVQNRIWFWLGEAKAVGDAEVRTGDGLDPAFGKKAVLGRVDGLAVWGDRGHPLEAERPAGGEDAVGRGRCRNPGDMTDLAAQPLIEGMTLDDAGCGATIGDRVRPAAGDLANRAHTVLAIHRYDLFRRAAVGDQHPGEMDADPVRDDVGVPFFDDSVDARHDDPEPHRPGHVLLLRRIGASNKIAIAGLSSHQQNAMRLTPTAFLPTESWV